VNKQIILTKVLQKLAYNKDDLNKFIEDFKKISESPEEIKQSLQKFEQKQHMSQQEKLTLIWEIKKKDLIKKDVPGVDGAWRAILKEWKIPARIWS